MITWSIDRSNGDSRTFKQWGIRSANASFINAAVGSIELGFGNTDLLGSLPFDVNEILLVLADGAPYFRGTITGERRGAFGSSEGATLILSDPWHYLEKITYQQQIRVVTDPTANPDPADEDAGLQITDFTVATVFSPTVALGQDQELNFVDARGMILDVLAYAISKGAPIAIGTIDPAGFMPADSLQDSTCAQVILKSLRWDPTKNAFWDFSVDPPELNILSRENRELRSLDIQDLVFTSIELNPRYDLVLKGVTVIWLRRHQRDNFEFITIERQTAGPVPEGINSLVITLELYGSYLSQTAVGPPAEFEVISQEPTPPGIALYLYEAYAALPWDGSFVLAADDVDLSISLANTIGILNGYPAWAAAVIDIQQLKHDLFKGRTTVVVGPPNHLGAQDLLALSRKGRTKAPSFLPGITPAPTHIPPNIPPHPPHPEPPHEDHDPSLYADSRITRTGSYNTPTGFTCGGSGAFPSPACPLPMAPLAYGPSPALTSVAVGGSSFSADLHLSKQRLFAPGPHPGTDLTCSEITSGSGSSSEWNFDLRILSANVIGAELIGTKSLSGRPDQEVRLPLAIGVQSLINLTAEVGNELYAPGSNSWTKEGAISYGTLRFYLRPGL